MLPYMTFLLNFAASRHRLTWGLEIDNIVTRLIIPLSLEGLDKPLPSSLSLSYCQSIIGILGSYVFRGQLRCPQKRSGQ